MDTMYALNLDIHDSVFWHRTNATDDVFVAFPLCEDPVRIAAGEAVPAAVRYEVSG